MQKLTIKDLLIASGELVAIITMGTLSVTFFCYVADILKG
jgi:hypothetical protein